MSHQVSPAEARARQRLVYALQHRPFTLTADG
jgi:hypothetical protein